MRRGSLLSATPQNSRKVSHSPFVPAPLRPVDAGGMLSPRRCNKLGYQCLPSRVPACAQAPCPCTPHSCPPNPPSVTPESLASQTSLSESWVRETFFDFPPGGPAPQVLPGPSSLPSTP